MEGWVAHQVPGPQLPATVALSAPIFSTRITTRRAGEQFFFLLLILDRLAEVFVVLVVLRRHLVLDVLAAGSSTDGVDTEIWLDDET